MSYLRFGSGATGDLYIFWYDTGAMQPEDEALAVWIAKAKSYGLYPLKEVFKMLETDEWAIPGVEEIHLPEIRAAARLWIDDVADSYRRHNMLGRLTAAKLATKELPSGEEYEISFAQGVEDPKERYFAQRRWLLRYNARFKADMLELLDFLIEKETTQNVSQD